MRQAGFYERNIDQRYERNAFEESQGFGRARARVGAHVVYDGGLALLEVCDKGRSEIFEPVDRRISWNCAVIPVARNNCMLAGLINVGVSDLPGAKLPAKQFARRRHEFNGVADAAKRIAKSKQERLPFLALSQRLFRPLAFAGVLFALKVHSLLAARDVARHHGDADDRACPIADRPDRDGNVDRTAIFTPPDRFVILDAFSGRDPGENSIFLVLPVFRDQAAYRLADHLLFAIAKEPGCGLVPARDRAAGGGAYDGVQGRGHNRGKPSRCRCRLHLVDRMGRNIKRLAFHQGNAHL